MHFDDVMECIEDARRKNFDYSEMELRVDNRTYENLREEVGWNLRNPKGIELDTVYGVDVVRSSETELRKETSCRVCGSEKVHHDSKEQWLCPFCEI